MKNDRFLKFLLSSKFQVALIFGGMAVWLVSFYKLEPAIALREFKDVALAYLAARVTEPAVEFFVGKLGCPKPGPGGPP
jgi:hypothetical protein